MDVISHTQALSASIEGAVAHSDTISTITEDITSVEAVVDHIVGIETCIDDSTAQSMVAVAYVMDSTANTETTVECLAVATSQIEDAETHAESS